MFNVFMWIVILLVIVGVGGAIYLLLKIMIEQKEIDLKYKDLDEEEKRKERERKKQQIRIEVTNSNFDSLLEKAKNNPDDLDELKKAIQDNLRDYIKNGDREKSRVCNEQLKRIDSIKKGGI